MIIRKKFKQKFIEYTITEDNKNFKNNFFYRYIVENIKMNSKKILLYIFINVMYKVYTNESNIYLSNSNYLSL